MLMRTMSHTFFSAGCNLWERGGCQRQQYWRRKWGSSVRGCVCNILTAPCLLKTDEHTTDYRFSVLLLVVLHRPLISNPCRAEGAAGAAAPEGRALPRKGRGGLLQRGR